MIGTISQTTILGNAFPNTAGVLYAEAVGIDNHLERTGAGAPSQEMTAAADGAFVVRATTTGAHEVGTDAYGGFLAASAQSAGAGPGVKGGVRVVPVNEEGSAAVDLLVSTNSTNGVAAMRVSINGVVPTADNVRDLGSEDHRMRTVHTHGVRFAPAALPAPAMGALALTTDGTGQPVLAVSDGTGWRRVVLGDPV